MSNGAFVKVVNRLLASPAYGERGAAIGSTSPATPIPLTLGLPWRRDGCRRGVAVSRLGGERN